MVPGSHGCICLFLSGWYTHWLKEMISKLKKFHNRSTHSRHICTYHYAYMLYDCCIIVGIVWSFTVNYNLVFVEKKITNSYFN